MSNPQSDAVDAVVEQAFLANPTIALGLVIAVVIVILLLAGLYVYNRFFNTSNQRIQTVTDLNRQIDDRLNRYIVHMERDMTEIRRELKRCVSERAHLRTLLIEAGIVTEAQWDHHIEHGDEPPGG